MDTRFGLAVNGRSQQATGLVCLWNGSAMNRELIGGDDLTRAGNISYRPGMFGNSWYFGGPQFGSMNESLKTGAAGKHNQTTETSVFVWARLVINPGYEYYEALIQRDEAGARVWGMTVFPSNKLYVAVFQDDSTYTDQGDIGADLNDGQWHHIGFTYRYVGATTSILSVFIDGMQRWQSTSAVGPLNNVSSAVYIGNRPALDIPWSGTIAEARIYNRQLSAAEVYRMYNPATRFDLYAPVMRSVAASTTSRASLGVLGSQVIGSGVIGSGVIRNG